MSEQPALEPFDSAAWWDPDRFLIGLHTLLDPVRIPYFTSVLEKRLPLGGRILDVGCGGGFVARGLDEAGYEVVGIDPSASAVSAAQSSGSASFTVAYGEELPFSAATFDAVLCSEVLEHVRSPARVLAEAARVMRPGGTLLFSLPNQTWFSRLVLIDLAQRWRPTRVLPPHLHDWERFIPPHELRELAERSGLLLDEVTGLSVSPSALPSIARAYAQLKTGRITFAQAGERIRLRTRRNKALAYIGHATLQDR